MKKTTLIICSLLIFLNSCTIVIDKASYSINSTAPMQGNTVTFNANGGEININSFFGTTLNIEDFSISRTRYAFGGFYKDKNLLSDLIEYPYEITNDITLYAKWYEDYEGISYSLVNEDNGYSISYRNFPNSLLTNNINIPSEFNGKSIIAIDIKAFAQFSNLRSVNIPSSIIYIGTKAFLNCTRLQEIDIPSSVAFIGDNAFTTCINLIAINVDIDNLNYSSIEGVLFNKTQTILITYPSAKEDSNYIIPDSVNKIEINSFYLCDNLIDVYITSNVNEVFSTTFFMCYQLNNIEVDNSNLFYSSDEGVLYNKTYTLLIFCPIALIGDYTILASTTTISQYAFMGSTLTSVTIPYSVVNIGYGAFTGWNQNQTIYITYYSSAPTTWDNNWDGHENSNSTATIIWECIMDFR